MNLPKCTESECEECGGKCCMYHLVSFPYKRPHVLDYYEQRAHKIEPFTDDEKLAWMYQPCPLFDEETKLCTDYENRNQVCKDFPHKFKLLWPTLCPLMVKKFGNREKGRFYALKI